MPETTGRSIAKRLRRVRRHSSTESQDRYEIRPYDPADRAQFLSLFSLVMDEDASEEWFDWKYAENPYTADVPMIVATADGDLVGARPLFALPVSVGGDRKVALQAGDLVVHPDHRRQGLFTRMSEAAVECYSDHSLFFSFPNERALAGYQSFGWEQLTQRDCYYRVEHPAKLAAARTDRRSIQLGSTLATPLVRGYNWLLDRRISPPQALSVERRMETPAAVLANLYREAIPAAIHAVRDEQFYEYRFENPTHSYHTYLAFEDDEPVAGIVVGQPASTTQTTKLVDVVPLLSPPEDALIALFDRILADHSGTTLFAAPPVFPATVLRRFGFQPDGRLPLSTVTSQTNHVVHTARSIGVDATEPENWLLTFAEEDTS